MKKDYNVLKYDKKSQYHPVQSFMSRCDGYRTARKAFVDGEWEVGGKVYQSRVIQHDLYDDVYVDGYLSIPVNRVFSQGTHYKERDSEYFQLSGYAFLGCDQGVVIQPPIYSDGVRYRYRDRFGFKTVDLSAGYICPDHGGGSAPLGIALYFSGQNVGLGCGCSYFFTTRVPLSHALLDYNDSGAVFPHEDYSLGVT